MLRQNRKVRIMWESGDFRGSGTCLGASWMGNGAESGRRAGFSPLG